MAVPSLQLPGYAAPQSLDFSSLANLGQVYKKAETDANRQNVLSQLGQGGEIDPKLLIGSGDLTLANLGIQLQNKQQEQARQAQQDARQSKNDEFSHNIQNQQLSIARQNADRLNASPEQTAAERAKAALANGVDPKSPEFKAYVLTGSLPASATNSNPHVVNMGGSLVDNKGNVLFKNDANSSLDGPTLDTMADQYLAGDKSVLQNLGRGAQGAANLVSLRNNIVKRANERNLDGNAIAQRMIDFTGDTSRERTAATQEGRMAPAGIEAQGAIDLGRTASAKVPRSNWVPVNQALQAYQRGTSNPELRAFGSANTTIINTYARAINPNGVGTVADKEHAREMLSTADGPDAYNAVLDQLSKEIEMAHQSPAKARAGFKAERDSRLNGKQPSSATQNTTSSGIKWSVQ